jgi:hypothetical protein
MRHLKFAGLTLAAAVASCAIMASAAAAKSALVLRDPSGVIPAGTTITAASTNLTSVTAAGNMECENSVLPAVLQGNDLSKLKLTSTEAHFFGDYLGIEGACRTSADGPALIEAEGLGWSNELTTSGVSTLKGTKKVAYTATFLGLEGPNDRCAYEASKVQSHFRAGAAGKPEALEFTTTNQPFKLEKKAPDTAPICSPELKISANWNVEDANGQVQVEQ